MSCNGGRQRATATSDAREAHRARSSRSDLRTDPYANVQVRTDRPADERFVNDPSDPASPRVAHDPVNDSGGTPAAATGTDPHDAARRVEPGSRWIPLQPRRCARPAQRTASTDSALQLVGPQPVVDGCRCRRRDRCTGGHGADRRRPPSRRAEPGVDGARCSPIRTREPARSRNRRSIRCPEIRRRTQVGPGAHRALVDDPRGRPASGCARVCRCPSGRRRSDDRVGHRRLRRRCERVQPRLHLRPDSDVNPPAGARRRRSAAAARFRSGAAPPMALVTSTASADSAGPGRHGGPESQEGQATTHFASVVLVLLLLAGLVGGALMFGRDYLFPEDWAKDVAPAVDALQLSSGLEFTDPVPVDTLPEAEYAARGRRLHLRPDSRCRLTTSMPRWRALGLVEGAPTVGVGERGRQQAGRRRSTIRPTGRSTAVPAADRSSYEPPPSRCATRWQPR